MARLFLCSGLVFHHDHCVFAVTLELIGFLLNGEYKREETVVGYLVPSNGLSIIRADHLTQVLVNEEDVANWASARLWHRTACAVRESGLARPLLAGFPLRQNILTALS